MEILYPSQSKFHKTMEAQVRTHRGVILEGHPAVTIDVRGVAVERGYEGDVYVEIDPRNQYSFTTEWEGSDPTRFPQRIRVAAWALHRNEIYGNFRISHSSGILRIKRI
jgi:hypothetical protein